MLIVKKDEQLNAYEWTFWWGLCWVPICLAIFCLLQWVTERVIPLCLPRPTCFCPQVTEEPLWVCLGSFSALTYSPEANLIFFFREGDIPVRQKRSVCLLRWGTVVVSHWSGLCLSHVSCCASVSCGSSVVVRLLPTEKEDRLRETSAMISFWFFTFDFSIILLTCLLSQFWRQLVNWKEYFGYSKRCQIKASQTLPCLELYAFIFQ